MIRETPEERAKRRRQRARFDEVAAVYDRTRSGYPTEIVDRLLATAGLARRSAVLEIGCGTGQLTEELARRDLDVTAIDLAPSMVFAARERLADLQVDLRVGAFEEFDPGGSRYDAIVSATAFHWIDPEVAWTKSADLLAPDGWIAILSTAERYDEPFAGRFRDQWIRYSDDGGAWASATPPTLPEVIAASGRFGEAVTVTHHERREVDVEVVVALEQTRATFLSYDEETRSRFVEDLRRLLTGAAAVALTQETTLTMAPRRS